MRFCKTVLRHTAAYTFQLFIFGLNIRLAR